MVGGDTGNFSNHAKGKKHIQKAHVADLAKLKTIESKLYAKPGIYGCVGDI